MIKYLERAATCQLYVHVYDTTHNSNGTMLVVETKNKLHVYSRNGDYNSMTCLCSVIIASDTATYIICEMYTCVLYNNTNSICALKLWLQNNIMH